jgi:F-type H+-transporting ATPase subunit delta
MRTTRQARREAKHLFRSCCVDGLLDEGRAREVLRRVLEAKPRGYLAVLSHFQRLVKLDVQRRTATVESAVALPSAMRDHLQANLARIGGRGLSIRFSENPTLIGGLRIKVGCDVYDGSIQTRLARLAESF